MQYFLKIEPGVRAGYAKKACTDEACKRNQHFVKKIKPELIAKINFYSNNAVEKYKHKQQKTTVFPGTFAAPKDENIGTCLEKLSKLQTKVVVLHSCSEHCTSSVPNYEPQNEQNFQILFEIYIQKII